MRLHRGMAAGVAGLLLTLAAAGCGPANQTAATPSPAPPAPTPVRIGLLTSQSGLLAGYGRQAIRGFNLGLEYATGGTLTVAGRRLEVIVRDDEGKPEVGVAQATDLLANVGVDILQGTASSAVAAQVIPLVWQYRRPLLIAPAAADALTGRLFNKYVFRVSANASQEIMAGAAQAARLGKSITFIAPDSAWGTGSVAAWQSVVRRSAPKVSQLPPVFVPLDTTDFTPYLNRVLKQGAAVCVLLWSGDGVLPLFQQVAASGLGRQMKLTTPIGDSEALKLLRGLDGLVGALEYHYTFPKTAANDWLVVQHRERFGAPPDRFTAGGFDAAVAIVGALTRTRGESGADRLVTALEDLTWEGVKGKLRFRRDDHQVLQTLYAAQVQGGPDIGLTLLREIPVAEVTPPVQVPR